MDEPSNTLDVSLSQTWESGLDPSRPWRDPRLRILYHRDLLRIGAVSEPDIPLTDAGWQTVGRRAPLFQFSGPEAMLRPLEDPAVSRQQLRLRWLHDAQRFEVEPLGKRRVLVVDPEDGSRQELAERTFLPPNKALAIGDRVLLALELGGHRAPEVDRLGLVGEGDAMWALRDRIAEVASFDGSALILGPTGAGKELVARALHRAGPRRQGPFVTVNCAALPEPLVESLLYGHVKGAFTGADRAQAGFFRAADGGTLFLDELGEMPIAVQPKLLRTLEDGRVATVGTLAETRVDVRLIAATNRDPETEITAGSLREDLYHRIARHVVQVPSLVERRLDIPELSMTFLGRLREQRPELDWLWQGAAVWKRRIPLDVFVTLMANEYPGNVRQLLNDVERIALRNRTPGPFRVPEGLRRSRQGMATSPDPEGRGVETSVRRVDPGQSAPWPTPLSQVDPDDSQTLEPLHLATASEALGIAQKTLVKLFAPGDLARCHQQAQGDPAALARLLRPLASQRLEEVLEQSGQAKRRAAANLGVSPTTFNKLLELFGRSTDGAGERARG